MGTRSSSTKIRGWAVTRRRCLNGSTIPVQGSTPDAKLTAMGPNQLALPVRPCFIEASLTVEKAVSCYKVDRLVASLLSFRTLSCRLSTQISCCSGRTLQTGPRTGVCEPLMPDVVVPKAHQNNRSYVNSVDPPSYSLLKNLAWWAVTRRTLKNHKIGGRTLVRVWVLAREDST